MNKVVFIDFETTGLDPEINFPTEIAIMCIGFNMLGQPYQEEYSSLIQLPEGVEVSEFITNLTDITTEMCNTKGKPIEQVIAETQKFFNNEENTTIVAQSANFDLGYLSHHFGYEPDTFICTKTIETILNPHLSTSLNDTHSRYFPNATFEQTHRAMDDVHMLAQIYDAQLDTIGVVEAQFFENRIAVMPDRPLVFTPWNAKLMDFSQKFSKKEKQ
jgi:DNA polymerase III subunit epsilon